MKSKILARLRPHRAVIAFRDFDWSILMPSPSRSRVDIYFPLCVCWTRLLTKYHILEVKPTYEQIRQQNVHLLEASTSNLQTDRLYRCNTMHWSSYRIPLSILVEDSEVAPQELRRLCRSESKLLREDVAQRDASRSPWIVGLRPAHRSSRF
jgi:hypothetical protein